MLSTVVRAAGIGRRSELISLAALSASYVVLLAAALMPHVALFTLACAGTYLADGCLHRCSGPVLRRLSQLRAGVTTRFLVRQFLLVVLLTRAVPQEEEALVAGVVCFAAFYALQAPHSALIRLIRARRRLPVVTRNVDLSAIRIPDGPPQRLVHRAAQKMLHLDLAAVAGLLAAAGTGTGEAGVLGPAVTVTLAVVYVAVLRPYASPRRTPPPADTVLAAVDDWLRDYRPTAVLYFSGSKDSAYQVNMWLSTMERLEGRPLILLRERHTVPLLGPTTVPVICVPNGVHLMNMDLSSARVAFYAANVGKNIHLLRVPTKKHVFIGHGDSDKVASVNPYCKAYDEVWTAGRAGRDRYTLADVGVQDENVVEVGRPQLDQLTVWPGPRPGQIPTVLYAPTWEGWDDTPGNTSLICAGESIVRALVSADPPVRVLYRPHPLTGIRSAAAAEAHRRIICLIEDAAAERRADPRWTADRHAVAQARAEMSRIEAEPVGLGQAAAAPADEAERSRDSRADTMHHAAAMRRRKARNNAYWRSFPAWEHRVVSDSGPSLYECFNASDGLVADISSVVSDFLVTGKPYAVTDAGGLGAEEFRRRITAARAAVILSKDAAGIDVLTAAVHFRSQDHLAHARAELKDYLVGPAAPGSMERFNAALRALEGRADRRCETAGAPRAGCG